MFLAEVLAVHADEEYMDENNRFDLNRARPMVYSHGEYLGIGKKLGTFGYSVKKRRKSAKKMSLPKEGLQKKGIYAKMGVKQFVRNQTGERTFYE